MKHTDTIIVGGGIAGLYCAWRLTQKNIPFILLEAQPQLGGRIRSEPVPEELNLAVDLGPTWYWPHQLKMQRLVADLKLEWFEQYTAGDVIYQMQPNQPIMRNAGTGAMTSFRVVGGMAAIIFRLVDKLEGNGIKLSQPVKSVTKVDDNWLVKTSNNQQEQQYSAKRLILAIPPRMIGRYLSPETFLPEGLVKILMTQPTWMSAQAKFVAVYEKPFWRDKGLAGQAFSRIGPMVEIHDASGAENSGYALFGFIGIPYQFRQKFSLQQMQSACIDQLGSIFGSAALAPTASYVEDWGCNKWVATEQDRAEAPKHPDINLSGYSKELKALDLHFVASEFAQQEAGYLEGALAAVDTAFENFPL
jgi:monoamine oxidase